MGHIDISPNNKRAYIYVYYSKITYEIKSTIYFLL